MRKLTEKLNSNSGATMMMALLLMLVAVTTSAIIIASAQSAAMNVKATEKDQQAILSVSSAADYIETELGKCTLTRKFNADYDYDFEVDKGKTSDQKSAFSPEVDKLVNSIGNNDSITDEFYINLSVDNTKLLPVKVKLELNNTYDFTVHLSIDSDSSSRLSIKQIFYSKKEADKTDSTIDTITWPTCEVYRDVAE